MNWCRIGRVGSVSCVWTISGTPVTLQQTTDATRRNVLTVTVSGLKMENTGWYRCGVGDLMMPVHITVRQQTTTQSTSTMTTTQAPTTEQPSFSPTAEPVQTDNTVQGPEGGKEKDTMRYWWSNSVSVKTGGSIPCHQWRPRHLFLFTFI
uniref:Ig-like domain-containing protein n=1 Tax=Hucho hucho TaxID=62062 RepID=A0A4W5NH52_9TELE